MAVVVDTGILYALADADDAWHVRSRAWMERQSGLLVVPVTVLPEVTYLLHTRLGSSIELVFLESVAAGELDIEPLRQADLDRCCEVMERYPDIGFVDASVVAVAERLKVDSLATTDRRHFTSLVPKHIRRFELVP
jgi:predicted nucleic acid-binding protein